MARLPPKAAAGERNGTMKTKFSKHLCRLFVFLLLSVMLATTAFADAGPKPSLEVRVEIEGEQREFYATLLSKEKGTVNHPVMEIDPNSHFVPETEPERAEDAFLRYQEGHRRLVLIANKNPETIHYVLNRDLRNMRCLMNGERTADGVVVPAETAVILADE